MSLTDRFETLKTSAIERFVRNPWIYILIAGLLYAMHELHVADKNLRHVCEARKYPNLTYGHPETPNELADNICATALSDGSDYDPPTPY